MIGLGARLSTRRHQVIEAIENGFRPVLASSSRMWLRLDGSKSLSQGTKRKISQCV